MCRANCRSDSSLNLNPRAYFFLPGPKITAHIEKSTAWLHVLAGGAYLNNTAVPRLPAIPRLRWHSVAEGILALRIDSRCVFPLITTTLTTAYRTTR